MISNEDAYKKKSQLLMQKILKTINIEIMLQYLKPNERKALYCILNYDKVFDDYSKYPNLNELTDFYDKTYGDKAGTFDVNSFIIQFSKLITLNYEFFNNFPCGIYLDLKDKFQKKIYIYTKILNSSIYSGLIGYDYLKLKDYYYSYEKVLTDSFINELDENNLYFNIIFLQGILTEIKDSIITLPSANMSLINSVLLGKAYFMMLKIYEDKQTIIHNRISEAYSEYIIEAIADIELKKDKIIDRLKEEGVKNKEKLNACEDRFKCMTKSNNDSLLNKFYEDIRNKDLEISELKNILLKKAEAEEKKIDSLNNKIYSVSLEKEKLQSKITDLEIQNSKLQAKIFEFKSESLIKSTSELKDYIDKHTDRIYELLKTNKVQSNQLKPKVSSEIIEPRNSYRIGYAALTPSGIEIVTPYGRHLINNIPDQCLIGEGQFLRVDNNNNFINTYKYYASYKVQFHLHPECKFGVIQKVNEKIFIDFGNNLIHPIIKKNIEIPKGQLVLADSFGNIKILFKKLHFNLDYFYEINKFRRMELWRVLSILDDKCIIENTDNANKEIFNMPVNYTLKNNDILLRKGDAVINVFSFVFYSHSRYYNKAVSGVAEVNDDIILLVKSNGEKVIVNTSISMPDIKTGDLITIDEFNNIIKYDKNTSSNIERSRIKSSIIRTSDKYKVKQIIISKKVLILGNPTYQQSYKLNFLKNGYQAEVIDGYSSWNRVQKSIKDIDVIVVVINYVSHDNMWQVKDNIKDIPVIYSDTDGANRIIELIENNNIEIEETSNQLDKVL